MGKNHMADGTDWDKSSSPREPPRHTRETLNLVTPPRFPSAVNILTTSELQSPGFGHKILTPPTVMRLLADQLKGGLLINLAGRSQFALRPQHHRFISRLAGKANALGHKPFADAHPSCRRLYQQQAQLSHLLRFLNEKNRADDLSAALRHPAVLARRIVVRHKLRNNLGDQCLKSLVVAIFLGIKDAMAVDTPTHVARFRLPKEECSWRRISFRACPLRNPFITSWPEDGFDRLHSAHEFALPAGRELAEDCTNLFIRPRLQRLQRLLAFLGQTKQTLPGIRGRGLFLD